jgi:hypothetical protein
MFHLTQFTKDISEWDADDFRTAFYEMKNKHDEPTAWNFLMLIVQIRANEIDLNEPIECYGKPNSNSDYGEP